jgi:hypothetical protein
MSTLYKRATPSQRRILRIVEGAVKNTADAHPTLQLTPRIARSIAKRAAGTLSAQWPNVLAAQMPSDRAGETTCASPGRRPLTFLRGSERGLRTDYDPRPPLRKLWKELSMEAGAAKKAGQMERVESLIRTLKAIYEILDECDAQ